MAIAIFLIPLYIGFLIVLCSAPLADSRAVFFAAKYEASVADEFGIDEGPATFTMQDHLNFLRERELERRRTSGTATGSMEASHRLESDEEDEPLSEEDYDDSQANERLHFSPFT
ncbi:uncharacterized protein [Physcomitrium patens]|uniref:Uncharacterized protein n=1 Tax=Physcomitrium patens TaxID=3218 RepID=A0A2K1KME3_PHYPA|nr:uncharacterized protein LOC112281753 isoform X4 [Physcomitrium patens]PNR54937.1 hypothetical protein PHYPA_005830 [Physcomitrium patens]|eukprot:XP_024374383.1 uncharacterized protein LOC112281753 isoform X4 [Physcomitrella patens]